MPLNTLEDYLQAIAMSTAEIYSNDKGSLKEILLLRDIVQEALWNMITNYVVDKRFRLMLEEYADKDDELLNV